jgi:transcriptional regulator with XRE-family HTH domain
MQREIKGFNTRLTQKMAERGISQADLCRLTGLASSMVSHYCTGQRMPSVPAALKIAKVLNTTLDYLAYGDPPHTKKSFRDTLAVGEKESVYKTKQARMKRIEDEQELVYLFRSLSKDGKAKVIEYIDDLLSSNKYS